MHLYRALFLAFVALPLLPGSEPAVPLRNSDPVYQALRGAALAESFNAEGITLKRDCATLQLKQGFLSFVAPQMGRVTLAVFTGAGEFTLDPVAPLEKSYLKLVTGSQRVTEPFSRAVFVFTDKTYDEVRQLAKSGPLDSAAAAVLSQHRERVRKRNEDVRSFAEAILTSESMDNLEADVLASLYNPAHHQFFNAFIQGQKRKDLRFFMRSDGALPDISSPEEVALVNVDPGENADGIWYNGHLREEIEKYG